MPYALILHFRHECDVTYFNFRIVNPICYDATDNSPVDLGDEFKIFDIKLERITDISGKSERLP